MSKKLTREQKERRDKLIEVAMEIIYSDWESKMPTHPTAHQVASSLGGSLRKFVTEIVREDL